MYPKGCKSFFIKLYCSSQGYSKEWLKQALKFYLIIPCYWFSLFLKETTTFKGEFITITHLNKEFKRDQITGILLTLAYILDIIGSAFCKDFESKSPASMVFIETRITKTTNKEDSYENIYGETRFY